MTTENPAAPKLNGQAAEGTAAPEFGIQRLYVRDLSLESPNSPEIFRDAWEPKVELELNTAAKKLADEIFDVMIKITTTVQSKDKVAFLIEVQQCGIFTIKGFNSQQLHRMLGSYCPGVLFPYAREVISDAAVRAGFPALYLSPVNFDALYDQQQQKQASEATTEASETTRLV